ncbi:uncharacterized protein LOC135225176 [Macrobrachium nipponense]|uniref:uncharacterized protein LOC135225176 n=1 Tax=Macrobrachium nipponense TaxID=159736 RepID=UPI0030C8004F
MKYVSDGQWWKVACVWTSLLVSTAVSSPLLGPHIMSFDSVSPFIEWQGPAAQEVVPTVVGNPLLPQTAGEAAGAGPVPTGFIIKAPCVRGRMDVSGCRESFNFPQRMFRDNPQFYMRGQSRGGPSPGRRIGRTGFPSRPEPETPEPERVQDD